MIDKLISFSLRNRVLIFIVTLLLVGLGVNAWLQIPIDAFPDVTNIQVQVISEAPGRSPVEVEKFITFPIEVTMSGLPDLTELRSLSKFGLSIVTVVFEDNVDIYFARQLVLERLIEAKERLPEGVETSLGPVTTGLGEIYQYTLEPPAPAKSDLRTSDSDGDASSSSRQSDFTPLTEEQLIDLRTMQDWL
ncbi:MAG: efflux RND transporter permease subunit, partial [Chlorobi bacterium CHB1]|nr:efflux RND transporter permease subunit [Chlorobi bacterium CHB1]